MRTVACAVSLIIGIYLLINGPTVLGGVLIGVSVGLNRRR